MSSERVAGWRTRVSSVWFGGGMIGHHALLHGQL
jgi:hypothetical protein